MSKYTLAECLELMERLERLNLLGQENFDVWQSKEYQAKMIAMHALYGYRDGRTPRPTGKAWSIDYAELIELSQTGRERLSNYLKVKP